MPTAIMPIMPPAIAPLFEFDFDVDPVATKTLKKVVKRHPSKYFISIWFIQRCMYLKGLANIRFYKVVHKVCKIE